MVGLALLDLELDLIDTTPILLLYFINRWREIAIAKHQKCVGVCNRLLLETALYRECRNYRKYLSFF